MTSGLPSHLQIRKSTPEDAEAIKLCADRTLTPDSIINLVYPPDRAHLTPPEEFHKWQVNRRKKMLEKGDGHNFIIVDTTPPEGEKVVAICRWDEPGRFAGDKSLSATIEDLTKKDGSEPATAPTTLLPGGESVPAAAADDNEVKKKAEDRPACMDVEAFELVGQKMDEKRKEIWRDNVDFWYLAALMVDPDYQRRGLARSLMQFGLDRADEAGVPCYLESSHAGRPVYPRFGFEKAGEIELTLRGKTQAEYVMVRPAKKRE